MTGLPLSFPKIDLETRDDTQSQGRINIRLCHGRRRRRPGVSYSLPPTVGRNSEVILLPG